MTLGSLSPRKVAPNQIPTSIPTRTSPIRQAVGAIQNRPSAGRIGRRPSSE